MANILAVDDDEKIHDLLYTILRRKEHHEITASYGQKGIELFRRERPHVTILDFEMLDRDGLEVPREIRAVDSKALPVIMLKGAGTETREKQAREVGVTELLAEGFSLHELGAALNLVLLPADQDRRKRARRA